MLKLTMLSADAPSVPRPLAKARSVCCIKPLIVPATSFTWKTTLPTADGMRSSNQRIHWLRHWFIRLRADWPKPDYQKMGET